MLIDTHCHLDVSAFDVDRPAVLAKAKAANVSSIVVPAISPTNFDAVIALQAQYPCTHYALGIHPLFVDGIEDSDLARLAQYLSQYQPVAVGEIGLDYFVTKDNREQQQYIYVEQLKLAKQFTLPVIIHVRGAIDDVLKYLRLHTVVGGIAHAFNGSIQQANQFIDLGFKLGFGGALTYDRALKLKRLVAALPLSSIVLETDAPDMAPAWLPRNARNSPHELLQIAEILAKIKGLDVEDFIQQTSRNALDVLPKIPSLCT